MKLMRLVMCVTAFALAGTIAMAEDMDVRALQAKLAAQEARLNDLQAKMYGAACDEKVIADGLTSLRKNAVVTIGGTVNTRYFYRMGEVKSKLVRAATATVPGGTVGDTVHAAPTVGNSYTKRVDAERGDLRISDAKLEFKIDVNEYFDAYLKLDLHNVNDGTDARRAGIAQNYWIRWKNVCNSGFGLLIGRDTLKWGGVQPYGALGMFTKNSDASVDNIPTWYENSQWTYDAIGAQADGMVNAGEGMLLGGGMTATHTLWDISRTTQITPYWESQNGAFKAEVSFLQAIDTINGLQDSRKWDGNDGATNYRSVNFGFGSMTGRMTWKPIEGLKLVASIMNLQARNGDGRWNAWQSGRSFGTKLRNDAGTIMQTEDSNLAVNFAFEYRPCFFNRLNLWASYTHSWNDAWIKDLDNDILSYGFGFDITDQLTFFASGDYMRSKNKQAITWYKGTGWAAYGGLIYTLPYGVNLEAGYKHESFSYKNRAGQKHTKAKADTIYAHVGFNF